jgi:hypothetical protein
MYVLISSLDRSSHRPPVAFCRTFEEALSQARELAAFDDAPCLIFEERLEVSPLEQEAGRAGWTTAVLPNGVLPGSNFPASLRKPGGAVL